MSSNSPRRSRAASPRMELAAPIRPRLRQASRLACRWKKPSGAPKILSPPRSNNITHGAASTPSIIRRAAFRSTGILPVGPIGVSPVDRSKNGGETPACPTGKMPVLRNRIDRVSPYQFRILFPPPFSHRLDRRRCLRLLFAFPGPFPKLDTFPDSAHRECLGMLGPDLRHHLIDRAPRRNCLEQFLKLAFRVHVDRLFHELRQFRRGLFEDKFPRRF